MATCDEPCDHLFEAATLSAQLVEAETERDEAVRRAAVMQGRFDEAMNQVDRLTKERDRDRAQERAEVLDEVSYRWDRRNEVGKPFSEWLWEWVNKAREASTGGKRHG